MYVYVCMYACMDGWLDVCMYLFMCVWYGMVWYDMVWYGMVCMYISTMYVCTYVRMNVCM